MGKVAGFLKKIKNLGKSIGGKFMKAAKWVNENIIRPNKDTINNLIEPLDKYGYGKKILDAASDKLHEHTQEDEVNTDFQNTIHTAFEKGKEMYDNRYNNGFDNATALNSILKTGVEDGKRVYQKYKEDKERGDQQEALKEFVENSRGVRPAGGIAGGFSSLRGKLGHSAW